MPLDIGLILYSLLTKSPVRISFNTNLTFDASSILKNILWVKFSRNPVGAAAGVFQAVTRHMFVMLVRIEAELLVEAELLSVIPYEEFQRCFCLVIY